MANWKKVIVSGSNAELNTLFTSSHITASGDVSGSSKWFARLDETDNQDILVAYDPSTGEFQYKNLSDFPGAPGS
jgi:hypothetical protein